MYCNKLKYLSIFWEYLYFTWVFIFQPNFTLHFLIKMYTFSLIHFPKHIRYLLQSSQTSEEQRLSTLSHGLLWDQAGHCRKAGLTNQWSGAFTHVQTSARTTADDSFPTQDESGVCDIQYIFCDNMVTVFVIMCNLTLSSSLYHQITHSSCTLIY